MDKEEKPPQKTINVHFSSCQWISTANSCNGTCICLPTVKFPGILGNSSNVVILTCTISLEIKYEVVCSFVHVSFRGGFLPRKVSCAVPIRIQNVSSAIRRFKRC